MFFRIYFISHWLFENLFHLDLFRTGVALSKVSDLYTGFKIKNCPPTVILLIGVTQDPKYSKPHIGEKKISAIIC